MTLTMCRNPNSNFSIVCTWIVSSAMQGEEVNIIDCWKGECHLHVGNVLKSWQIAREGGGDAWAGLQELWQHETSTFLAWLYRCHTTNSSINAGCCSRAKWNTSAHSKIREIFSLFFMNNQAAAVKGGIKEKLCQHPKPVCAPTWGQDITILLCSHTL